MRSLKIVVTSGVALAVVLLAGNMMATEEAPSDYQAVIERFPDLDVKSITPSAVPGLLELQLDAEVAYVSADGQYLIRGDIIDLDTRKNLTEDRRSGVRLALLEDIGDDSMVVFGPEDAEHTVSIFTDIDCPYCRKLHREIEQYNSDGIRVRYLFFPRGGPGSEAWLKSDSVWCADDRAEALTRAKSGEVLAQAACTTPVTEHYELGLAIGIRGTPAILTDSGELIGGYVPPSALAQHLNGET